MWDCLFARGRLHCAGPAQQMAAARQVRLQPFRLTATAAQLREQGLQGWAGPGLAQLLIEAPAANGSGQVHAAFHQLRLVAVRQAPAAMLAKASHLIPYPAHSRAGV